MSTGSPGGIPEAYIYDAIRTPRGRGKASGSLHEVKPISLVVGLINEVRRRFPELDPAAVDDIVLGVVTPLGDQGGDIAKTAAIAAGLPDTVAGVQLNRFCASGLEAVNQAALRVRSGMEELILAGGVEAMSRVAMGSDGGAWAMDPDTNYHTGFVPQGVGADLIATLEGYSREDVDTFAVESQTRAAKAWANGYFARSVVPVLDRNGLTVLDRDEHIRANSTLETLGSLPPSFAMMGEQGGFDAVALQRYHWVEKINHVHHAGNSSGIVDGAALCLIGTREAGRVAGIDPRARIVATAVSGADPTIMLTGPAPASRKALAKAGLTVSDIDLFEINEAFAAVAMRFIRDMGISPEQTNVNGGAIAMGHPLGATGAMLIGTLLDELERRDLRRGLATLCVGGGMGIAAIIERV
jgi:acetyl-CoA C-acetyltransferase